jgi:hypothetical protein
MTRKFLLITAALVALAAPAYASCMTKGTVTPHVEANVHSPTLPSINGEVFFQTEKHGWVFVDIQNPGWVGSKSPTGAPQQIHGGWIRQKEFECLE